MNNKSELEKFVNLANPNGTKQEFTYTKFVDELWKSAKKSGKGLIGKNKNDLVEIKTPSGEKNFEIEDVKYL